jgi:hypothetical protein
MMKTYTEDDLAIVADPISVLRRQPSMFMGDRPWGPYLAARMARDLILLDALPVRIERENDWWLIESDVDWLRMSSEKDPFRSMVTFPAAGHAAFRSEVLLSAFADAVVTGSGGRLDWITTSAEVGADLPEVWKGRIASDHYTIRFLAFKISGS